PHGQRRCFAHGQRWSEARPAFCWTQSQVMLNAVPLERSGAAIIHMHRQRHGDGTLWIHQALAIVLINAQIISDDLKLVARHLKHVVVVNTHEINTLNRSVAKCRLLFALSEYRRQLRKHSRVNPESRTSVKSTISFATRSVRSKKSITMKIEPLAVHAGHTIDPAPGAVSSPIHLSTTFERDPEGTYSRGFMYTRNNNPNRQALEQGISALESGE